MRELCADELELAYGGSKYPGQGLNAQDCGQAGSNNWQWDDGMRKWGGRTAAGGGTAMGLGVVITQADSPLPGPADAIGAVTFIGGALTALVGAASYLIGSGGGVADHLNDPKGDANDDDDDEDL